MADLNWENQSLEDKLNSLLTDITAVRTAAVAMDTLIDELHDDHATNKTFMDEVKTDLNAAVTDIAALRAAVVAITAKLDADGGVTDTNYAATCDPAAQTSTSVSASPAGTLTASKPDAAAALTTTAGS